MHPQVFLKKVECANHHEQKYCSQLIKRAANHQVRLHILANSTELKIVGFVAISASELINSPCVTIDYLLTTPLYRGIMFKELPLYRSLGFIPLDKTGWLFFKINQ